MQILARLDMCYVFKNSNIASRHILSYIVHGDIGWSDHLLLECTIQPEEGQRRNSRCQMSTFWLDEAISMQDQLLTPI